MGLTAGVTALATEIGADAGTAAVIGDVGAGAIEGAGVGGLVGGGEAALTGGNIGKGILSGGETGAITGGVGAGIGDAYTALGGVSGIENSLGIGSAPATATNPAGATIDSATGQTVAAPSTATTPSFGGGFTPAASAPDQGNIEINTQLAEGQGGYTGDFSGAQTTGSTGTGSVAPAQVGASPVSATTSGASANSATGATDQVGPRPQATAAAPTPAAGGTAAPQSFLQQAEGVGIKAALPLGALAYEAIKGPASLPASSSALASGGSVTGPLQALENQGATEASTGQLTAPQQANITQFIQQSQNQLIQQLASEGVVDPTKDSRYIQGMQQIQLQAQAAQQQYITAAISEATSAGGAASQNIATVANEQIQNDTAYTNALAAAFGALGGSIGGNVNLGSVLNK